MSLLTQALIASLIMFIAWTDNQFTHVWLYRPIVMGPLMGLCMGNLAIGLEVGATIELMFLATVWVGTATPPNETLSCGIATALAITTGDVTLAIATALPLALLGTALVTLRNTVCTVFTMHRYEAAQERLDRKGMIFWSIIVPTFVINVVLFVVPTFIAVYWGTDVATSVLSAIPANILSAVNCGGKMIGAVGLAMLLVSIDFKSAWPFFFVGFIFSAYLGINNMGITLIAVIVVALIYMFKKNAKLEGGSVNA